MLQRFIVFLGIRTAFIESSAIQNLILFNQSVEPVIS